MTILELNVMRFGLLGHRVGYSLSPVIHNFVFKTLGRQATYEIVDVEPNEFDSVITNVLRSYKGLNVTIPYKRRIIWYTTSLDDVARDTSSVNTVKINEDEIAGYNTDHFGIVRGLEHFGIDVSGTRALIVGAGGAAYTAVYSMHSLGVSKIIVVNRTFERALELREHYRAHGIDVQVYPLSRLCDLLEQVDVIVNCTPVGMMSDESIVDPHLLDRSHVVIDLVYRPRMTKLIRAALSRGCKIVDGLTILIYQALRADEIWLDVNGLTSEDMFRAVEMELSKYVDVSLTI